jgi:hypothetical protein
MEVDVPLAELEGNGGMRAQVRVIEPLQYRPFGLSGPWRGLILIITT